MIVSCANCGKKFKGSPGPRKFKCSGCANLFTFPETAMAPAEGHILCSNCWSEMKANPDLRACPMCSQKLSASHGGKAVEESAPPPQPEAPPQPQQSPATRQEQPPQPTFLQPPAPQQQVFQQETHSEVKPDLFLRQPDTDEQEIQAQPSLQQPQPPLQPPPAAGDDSAYRERAERAEAQVKELEEQINAFREAALGALTPLVPEVNRLMQALSDEVAQIQTLVSQARQHLQATASPPERLMGLSELQKLESAASEMQGRVEAIRTTLISRLQEVLGEPEDAPAS